MIVKDIYKLNTPNWQHKLNTVGEIVSELEDVGQCIEAICTTQKGSVVHNPDLGTNVFDLQDEPVITVQPKIRKILIDDITSQEPRAEVNDIQFNTEESQHGRLIVRIKYSLKTTGESAQKDIALWQTN